MLLPARPGRHALLWWAATEGEVPTLHIEPAVSGATISARRLGRGLSLVAVAGIAADTDYELTARFGDGRTLRCLSRTLPEKLETGAPFTFTVGSCYGARDGGRLASMHPPPRLGDAGPVRFKAHLGDQVYLDLEPGSTNPLSARAPDVWARYDTQWRSASWSDFLCDGPNLFLPDDHEYWNNFPHGAPHLLWTPASPAALKHFHTAYEYYQGACNLDPAMLCDPRYASERALSHLLATSSRTFRFDEAPAPMFFLDLRTRRGVCDCDEAPLADAAALLQARAWLYSLDAPGVLFISQPLVPTGETLFGAMLRNSIDCFPIHYRDDFAELCAALFDAPHDVLVCTGDIHFNRLLRIERGVRRVYELSASPYSRIAGDRVNPDDVHHAGGTLTWKGNVTPASYTRCYGLAAEITFTTVTLRRVAASQDLVVHAQVWGDRGGKEVSRLETHTFTLH